MSEAIIVALISGGLAFAGTVLTVWMSSKKSERNLRISQAVTETKIEELTREVREHNNFARRMPVVEQEIKNIKDRLQNLERGK